MNENVQMNPKVQMNEKQKKAIENLKNTIVRQREQAEDVLWDTMALFAGQIFYTTKNLEFSYLIKGNELFVSRKEKSITRATVNMAFRKALELGDKVTGPKKLGTFGASYLYPIFRCLGIIP